MCVRIYFQNTQTDCINLIQSINIELYNRVVGPALPLPFVTGPLCAAAAAPLPTNRSNTKRFSISTHHHFFYDSIMTEMSSTIAHHWL